eukprot:4237514-Prymnesium_polylepis.1
MAMVEVRCSTRSSPRKQQKCTSPPRAESAGDTTNCTAVGVVKAVARAVWATAEVVRARAAAARAAAAA